MLSEEEKKELQELINLLYNGHISQYGKRKLEAYIKKQQKEIEELKKYEEGYKLLSYSLDNYISKDKIKAKIEELEKEYKEAYNKGFKTDMVNRLREIKLMQSLLEKE
jgi:hypothetical protein